MRVSEIFLILSGVFLISLALFMFARDSTNPNNSDSSVSVTVSKPQGTSNSLTDDSSSELASPSSTTVTRTTASQDSDLPTLTINTSDSNEVKVHIEIADDTAERAQGLMYRTGLGVDKGMLFVYEDGFIFNEESIRSFWMKNTLIPLSIAFIDSEGRIVDIQKMEPVGREQTVSDTELPRYVSAEPARYALEVNQGFFEQHGVEVGDTVELPV
ncbi:hypothetical protein BH24ACT22_BH24ACT22_07690 [soil metagenome]